MSTGRQLDRQWAKRHATGALNHIFERYLPLSLFLSIVDRFYSLGERSDLRTIPASSYYPTTFHNPPSLGLFSILANLRIRRIPHAP